MSRRIVDRRVLASMSWVPREQFVPESLGRKAYADTPLPIGFGQTISQPYMVALMTQAAHLHRGSRVLEIGTGSGYHTAILAKIVAHVWSIERFTGLSEGAAQRLERLRIRNVTLLTGDGANGCPYAAPFEAILVAAATLKPPHPLLAQLAQNGRMIIPIGDSVSQHLTVFERHEGRYEQWTIGACRFVPFVSPPADG